MCKGYYEKQIMLVSIFVSTGWWYHNKCRICRWRMDEWRITRQIWNISKEFCPNSTSFLRWNPILEHCFTSEYAGRKSRHILGKGERVLSVIILSRLSNAFLHYFCKMFTRPYNILFLVYDEQTLGRLCKNKQTRGIQSLII